MADEEVRDEKQEEASRSFHVYVDARIGVSKTNHPSEATQSSSKKSQPAQNRLRVWRALRVCAPLANLLATIVIAAATTTYTIYARRQWKTMRQQLEMAERPWVSADVEITTPLTLSSSDETRVAIRITMKNVGHSVATGVSADAWVIFLSQ